MSKVQCNNCLEQIESKNIYHYVSCGCWETWLFGGDELMLGGGCFRSILKSDPNSVLPNETITAA